MEKMSKILTFAMITCLMLSIFGCSSQNNTSSGPVITIAARDGSHSDVINAVKTDFEKENNCTVNVVSLGNSELHDSIIEEATKETGKYDIIMIDDPLMPEYIEKKIITNLTKLGYADDEDFVEKSRLLGKDPYPLGATYSLPFSGNVQLIFYNSTVITDESVFDNWDSILTACESVKTEGTNGYAIRGQSGNPIVSDFLPILWAFGGDLFDENNKVILDSKESRDALEFYCKLYKSGDNYAKDDLVNAVNSGEAGVSLGWPSWFVTGEGPTASIAQIPGKKDASSEVLPTGEIGNWLLGITENSANKELALKLAVYLTSTDVQKKALDYGGIPTRKSVFKDKTVLEKYPYFNQVYSGTNNSRVRPRTTKWSRIEDVFGQELVKCIEGTQSVDDTITKSSEAIAALAKE